MLRKSLPFLLDFAPVLVYYGAEWLWNLKVALILSIVWVLGECAWKLIRRQPFTPLFVFTSLIVILFGAIDLYLGQTSLFRYEPVATNLLVGAFFLSTLFVGKAIVQELAEKQKRPFPPIDAGRVFYFRFLTLIFMIYFWLKAAAYLWIAEHYTMEQLTVVRLLAGSTSLYALIAVSVFFNRPIRHALYRIGLAPMAPAASPSPPPADDCRE